MSEWNIITYREIPKETIMFVGVPDVGLVGSIAASFIVSSLKLELSIGLDSDKIPPIVLFHKGKPYFPVRLYSSNKFSVLISEIALPIEAIYSLSKLILDIAIENKVKRIVILSGVPVPNRIEIKTPRVFAATISNEITEFKKSKDIELLKEGIIGGIYASILKESIKRKFPSYALLAESHLHYPDPGAAGSLIEKINQIYDTNIDTKPLFEQAEEIRLKLRELMKRTLEQLRRSGKEYEYTIPHLYA